MKQTAFSVIGIIIVAVVAFFAYRTIFYKPVISSQLGTTEAPVFGNEPGNYTSSSTTASGSGTTTMNDTVLTLSGAQGAELKVRNFLKDPDTYADPINKGYYYLGYKPASATDTSMDASSTPPSFIIEYVSSTDFFNVILAREPLAASRQEAEQYLMKSLNIPQNELCELKYMVSVPYYVNQFYTGTNLGFDSCPDAADLPQ